MLLIQVTLPETNSSPLKMMVSNRNLLFQGSIFRGYVSFREGSWLVVDTPSKVWEEIPFTDNDGVVCWSADKG